MMLGENRDPAPGEVPQIEVKPGIKAGNALNTAASYMRGLFDSIMQNSNPPLNETWEEHYRRIHRFPSTRQDAKPPIHEVNRVDLDDEF